MSNYTIYISDGKLTLNRLSQMYQTSISSILDANRQDLNIEDLPSGQYPKTTSTYLSSLKANQTILKGVVIVIPERSSGGIDESEKSLYNSETLKSLAMSNSYISGNYTNYSSTATRNTLTKRTSNLPSSVGNDSITDGSLKKFDCYFYLLANGDTVGSSWYLPVYPNEFSDSNTGSFSNVSVLGRSVDYQIYNGSGRNVSLSLALHEELVPSDYDYIHRVVAALSSACYPEYSAGVVKPPEIVLVIGKHFRIRGIVTGCSSNWSAPIIDGKLVTCQVALSITETLGPYSMSEIQKMKAFRS